MAAKAVVAVRLAPEVAAGLRRLARSDERLLSAFLRRNCSTESTTIRPRNRSVDVMTCYYAKNSGALLTFVRTNLEDAKADVRANTVATPEFKRAFVKQVFGVSTHR